MSKILLCCEGVSDQGYAEYRDGEYVHVDGTIQKYLQKLALGNPLVFVVKKRADIERFQVYPSKKFASAPQKKARKLAAMAQQAGCRHIAYHRDEDNEGFQTGYDQVRSYFAIAEAKGMRCLAIVPMHMTENWLLSDAGAFPSVPNNPPLPKKPEETWGKKGTDDHPKKYMERVLAQFHLQPSAGTYGDIAEHSRVEIVCRKCPVSFRRLCEDMREFLATD